MLLKRGFLSFFRAISQFGLAGAASRATSQRVRLAIISEGVNTWPLYVAQAKNFFEREGVEVAVTLTGSSARQLEQLKAGDYDIGFQQSDHVVRGVEQGSDLFIFMVLAHAPELSLVVAPDVGSFADLRGRQIAVDGARTGYALLLGKLLAEKGLRKDDYALREIGGSAERFDALRSGAAAASLLNPPFDRNLFALGFRSLGATSDYFPTYPGSIAATRRGWARQHRAALVAFIRGFDAGYGWLQDERNRDEAIAILLFRLNIEPGAAARAFEKLARRPGPAIRPDDLRQVIDIVWDAESLGEPRGEPDRYIDLEYWREAVRVS
ncbi:MAG: ABC transporter substrate-binding protein [Betaproteobacteria bacterium]|nr:ABC transporter substrate-binding protein [Betaproteobacteria bacterium]